MIKIKSNQFLAAKRNGGVGMSELDFIFTSIHIQTFVTCGMSNTKPFQWTEHWIFMNFPIHCFGSLRITALLRRTMTAHCRSKPQAFNDTQTTVPCNSLAPKMETQNRAQSIEFSRLYFSGWIGHLTQVLLFFITPFMNSSILTKQTIRFVELSVSKIYWQLKFLVGIPTTKRPSNNASIEMKISLKIVDKIWFTLKRFPLFHTRFRIYLLCASTCCLFIVLIFHVHISHQSQKI